MNAHNGYQPVPRCFYCDTWITDDEAILTPAGKVMCIACADDFTDRTTKTLGVPRTEFSSTHPKGA